MGFEIIIAQAFWLILPAYIANASAVLVGGGTPIDFGKNWKDGKRILGDGKTWKGLIIGTLVGMIGGFGLSVASKYIAMTEFAFVGISDFYGFPLMMPIVFSICFGALMGDIIESFFKIGPLLAFDFNCLHLLIPTHHNSYPTLHHFNGNSLHLALELGSLFS